MGEILENLKFIFSIFTLSDYIYFGLIIFLMILLVVLLYFIRNSEETLEWDLKLNEEPKEEQQDILEIARAIEANDEHLNIDLTAYEMAEEETSIISYEELLSHNKQKSINYEEETNNEDLVIKKVDLLNPIIEKEKSSDTIVKPLIISYEKEEALLAALKELQRNLSKSL